MNWCLVHLSLKSLKLKSNSQSMSEPSCKPLPVPSIDSIPKSDSESLKRSVAVEAAPEATDESQGRGLLVPTVEGARVAGGALWPIALLNPM